MNRQQRPLHALAGHAVDLWRLARFDVSNPHSLSKYRMLRAVQRRTGARTLLETGTYLGVTTARCAPYFEKVYTIEIEPELARKAAWFLTKHRNVSVIAGDADREVRRLFAQGAVTDALVFLDGHFSGGDTGSADEPEPAVSLLNFLADHADKIRGIVVDDFREFGSQPGWPKKWELVKAAEERFVPCGFRLAVQLDQLLIERIGA